MTNAPAGWYPDPSGAEQERWWDGAAWTPQVRQHAATVTSPSPQPAPYTGAAVAASAPAGTSPWTPWIWVATLLPAVNLVLSLVQLLTPGYVDGLLSDSTGTDVPVLTPLDIVGVVLALVIDVLVIVAAARDHRALVRRGVPRPFHWAFAFLVFVGSLGAAVYPIGRSVIVRRRTGRGLAPLVIAIVIAAATLVYGIAFLAIVIGSLADQFSSSGV